MSFAPRSSSLLPRASPTMSSPPDSIRPARSSASGASDSAWPVCPAWRANPVAGARPAFPPSLVVQVKALACELPHRQGLPLSRFSIADIRQEVLAQGLVAEISGATIWRWLSQDANRPWRYRSWIFPRDPLFLEKAAPILDLYQGMWQGQPPPVPRILCLPLTKSRAFKHDVGSTLRFLPPLLSQLAIRARVRAQGRLGLPRRLGPPARPNLRSLRTPERDPNPLMVRSARS